MGSRLSDVVIDALDPGALAEWWGQVLGCEVQVDGDERYLEPPDSVRGILFEPVSEPKTVKNRVHLDVRPHGCEQTTELERLLALGARRVDIGQGDQTWVVLADPEGNEFCLLRGRFDEPDAVS